MNNIQSIIDWIFTTFINLWTVIIAYWALSVPILLCIFANIFILIKGIYKQ